MKVLTLCRKFICTVLMTVLLLQSCTIYKKSTIDLDQAVASHKKVLLTRNNDKKLHLKKIEFVDGGYLGSATVKGKGVKVPIDASDIKSIRPINKSATVWANIGMIGIPVIVITVAVAAASVSDWGDTDYSGSYLGY
jgi:hypothetical protein